MFLAIDQSTTLLVIFTHGVGGDEGSYQPKWSAVALLNYPIHRDNSRKEISNLIDYLFGQIGAIVSFY